MEFPEDIIAIIREFSKPLTRPDWRRLQWMTMVKFHFNIKSAFNERNISVINTFVERYDQQYYKYIFGQGRLFEPLLFIQMNKN